MIDRASLTESISRPARGSSNILKSCISIIMSCSSDAVQNLRHEIERALVKSMFEVHRDIYVPSRGDGYRGRLSLVALKDGTSIAICMDYQTLREKSLVKLRQCGGYRILVFWGGTDQIPPPPGIDIVIGMNTKRADFSFKHSNRPEWMYDSSKLPLHPPGR